jgi:hypothetical protein
MKFFQACADKLKREMEQFGFPPKFPEHVEEVVEEVQDNSIPKDKSKGIFLIINLCKLVVNNDSIIYFCHRQKKQGCC